MDLSNKKYLVFGSSAGIPNAIVKELIKNEAKVLMIESDTNANQGLINDLGFDRYCFDYFQIDEIDSFFKTTIQPYGPFDGLVFAGGIGGVRPMKQNKFDFVKNMFAANVFSFIEILRVGSKKNILLDGSSIVAISSVSSIKGLKSKSVYSASKAALEATVRTFAIELAERKIRINSIQKGWVSSDMNLSFIQENMNLSEDNDFKNQILGVIEPEEIASLVSFLLSDAVKTMTGTTLLLDGGYTL